MWAINGLLSNACVRATESALRRVKLCFSHTLLVGREIPTSWLILVRRCPDEVERIVEGLSFGPTLGARSFPTFVFY